MNCIFSIKKQYSDLIFNKTKPIEFRNVCPKLEENDKVFIYETKNGGCGKVVGYFLVDEIKKIPFSKVGTYLFMDIYANLFCDDETKNMVNKAKQIDLEDCYNDFVLSYLFMDKYLDKMLKTHKPISINFYAFNSNDWKNYSELEKKTRKFLDDCDNWLYKIGFYNSYDYSDWKYQINIKDAIKFENPMDITQFQLKNGKFLNKAPQSFCYTLNN